MSNLTSKLPSAISESGGYSPVAGGPLLTLPEQIAERIYGAIVTGEYAPGGRIREEELASRFQVSRGPVREALRILERDSVVRVLANRGAHVTRLSAKELNDIFEIRKVLTGAMARRLASASPALIAQFRDRVKELEELAEKGEAGEYVAASVSLSLTLAQASGNDRLAEILRSLARQSWRYTQLALHTPARRKQSALNWTRLLEALLAGQSEAAGQAMEKLVDDARHEAVRLLESAGDRDSPSPNDASQTTGQLSRDRARPSDAASTDPFVSR